MKNRSRKPGKNEAWKRITINVNISPAILILAKSNAIKYRGIELIFGGEKRRNNLGDIDEASLR
jgi:hypothetical protein